jgi:hypothetical protein
MRPVVSPGRISGSSHGEVLQRYVVSMEMMMLVMSMEKKMRERFDEPWTL